MKKKLHIIAFSVILLTVISSCVNRPLRPVDNDADKTNAEIENKADSEMISIINKANEVLNTFSDNISEDSQRSRNGQNAILPRLVIVL